MLLAGGEFVGKDVGERGDAGGGVLRERGGDRGAATAAAEQAEADGGVGLIAEGGFRLDDEEASGRGGASLRVRMTTEVGYVISARTFSRYCFSWRTSSICWGPLVSRSMVMAPV